MKNNNWMLLVNPFTKIAGWKAFVLGMMIMIATVCIGYINHVCFPGLISIKISLSLSLVNAFIVQLIGWLPTVLLVWLAGIIFSRNVRFQDALGMVTFARFPYLFVASLGFIVEDFSEDVLVKSLVEQTFNPADYIGMMVFGLVCLLFSVWSIALLYNAFRVSTDIRGVKAILIFIGIVVLSEILSLIGLYAI